MRGPYNVLLERPKISDRTNKIKKMKNRTFAIPAAPAAIPPNPNMAAIIATIRKIIVQRNITYFFRLSNTLYTVKEPCQFYLAGTFSPGVWGTFSLLYS